MVINIHHITAGYAIYIYTNTEIYSTLHNYTDLYDLFRFIWAMHTYTTPIRHLYDTYTELYTPIRPIHTYATYTHLYKPTRPTLYAGIYDLMQIYIHLYTTYIHLYRPIHNYTDVYDLYTPITTYDDLKMSLKESLYVIFSRCLRVSLVNVYLYPRYL